MRLLVAGMLALAATACGATATEVRGVFAAAGLPRVNVTIALPRDHSDPDRYLYAALTTLKVLGQWLGPFPDSTLTVKAAPTPWWSSPTAMAPELVVARAVSRRYWERAIDTRMLPQWFVGGLSEYCARRAVSAIVDEQYGAIYRSRAEGRYFGGFVPRDLRVPLRVEDEGDPVDDYRARPSAADTRALEAKTLLALGTLERWVGRPTFDAVLSEFVRAGGQPTLDRFGQLASRVSGQDLTWFFDQTLKDGVFDYGVSSLSSRAQPDGSYRTMVTVQRFGDGIFSGPGDASDGTFERGRAIIVETIFSDGEIVRDTWDGRSREKAFEYRSQSPAVSSQVDPDRVLLLDLNRSNNGVTLDRRAAGTAATRWAARWMIWMEDALLTCVAFT